MKIKQGNICVDKNAVMKEILISAENSPQKANLVLTIEEANLLINEIQKNINDIKPASQDALNLVSEKVIQLEERIKILENKNKNSSGSPYDLNLSRNIIPGENSPEPIHNRPDPTPRPPCPPGYTPSRRGGCRQLGVYDG